MMIRRGPKPTLFEIIRFLVLYFPVSVLRFSCLIINHGTTRVTPLLVVTLVVFQHFAALAACNSRSAATCAAARTGIMPYTSAFCGGSFFVGAGIVTVEAPDMGYS